MLNEVLRELTGEIDRSTLQCVVVEDPKARYVIPPEIVEEVLKHLLGEFLIGLLGLELLHGLGQQLHRAVRLFANWVTGGQPPRAAKVELDAALEEALVAARCMRGWKPTCWPLPVRGGVDAAGWGRPLRDEGCRGHDQGGSGRCWTK